MSTGDSSGDSDLLAAIRDLRGSIGALHDHLQARRDGELALRRRENALNLFARFQDAQHPESGALHSFLHHSVQARTRPEAVAGLILERTGFALDFVASSKAPKSCHEAALLIERLLPHVAVERNGADGSGRVLVSGIDAPIVRRIIVMELNRLDDCYGAAELDVADKALVERQLDPYLEAASVWRAVAITVGKESFPYVYEACERLQRRRAPKAPT